MTGYVQTLGEAMGYSSGKNSSSLKTPPARKTETIRDAKTRSEHGEGTSATSGVCGFACMSVVQAYLHMAKNQAP
jgi:hypothetical protein